jgi:hypothetical protein
VGTGEVFAIETLSARSMSMHITQGKSFNMTCERASFVYYKYVLQIGLFASNRPNWP